ncbi:MAG: type II toxin-antitoxin system RatA family toxin [Burkholderiales bacterium]
MVCVKRSALVDFPAKVLYELVADIESYPRFLPWCPSAKIDVRATTHTDATLHIAYRGIRQQFSTRNTNQPDHQIDMELLSGPFRHLRGTWRFEVLSPDASKVSLNMEYQFANGLLDRLIGPVFEHIANTFVDAFVRRANELQGRGT